MRVWATPALLLALWMSPGPAVAQYDGLPEGEARDLVFGVCTPCHSARIITQQGKSRSEWDRTLTWMVTDQGMAELPDDMREDILDYLAEHFPPERGGGGPGTTFSPPPLMTR